MIEAPFGLIRTSSSLRKLICSVRSYQSWANADIQLETLSEVREATQMNASGNFDLAIPLLQRSIEILRRSLGKENVMTQAARRRLGMTYFWAEKFDIAEEEIKATLSPNTSVPHSEYIDALLFLSRIQLFGGNIKGALETCINAVSICEGSSSHTPDTEILGNALRALGILQMISLHPVSAETSLLRAARLCSNRVHQAQALSNLAAFNLSLNTSEGHREAKEYWQEALALTTTGEDELDLREKAKLQRIRASILSNVSEVSFGEASEKDITQGNEKEMKLLLEALKLCEESMKENDPNFGWILGHLARRYRLDGNAVTSEGLFRSALDKLDPENVKGKRAIVEHPSPMNKYMLADILGYYSELLLQWEDRESDGMRLKMRAEKIKKQLLVKPPHPVSLPMLHLCS